MRRWGELRDTGNQADTICMRIAMKTKEQVIAGIESWCRAHGLSSSATVPLRQLAQDNQARFYALRLARRIIGQSHAA